MKLPKIYEPKQYELDIYDLWEKSGSFAPRKTGKSTYSVVMPPPNANGELHLGHAFMVALQDTVVRYQRMQGRETVYLPGADHAGFETWVVYEKKLNQEGKTRFDFNREELYRQVWEFVQGYKTTFEHNFRRLGASCDWSRFTFTLDESVVKTAYTTFKKMWDEGLIYRGKRLVNFCTKHGTSFSDIEVEFKNVKGKLWQISYPLTDGSGSLAVATTRPETMLGDTAVAVHPTDKRYQKFIGKTVKLPLTQREIPIIADEMVDTSFGTGAVKVTPAHDPNDFEVAKRHDLPFIEVIDHEGRILHDMPEAYRGLSTTEARKRVVADLDTQGHVVSVTDHEHSVGHCYKCGTVIEPLLREQWFVDMQPLAQPAIKALKADQIAFHPASKREQLIHYMEGIRDWNISRQIAWGIPIPAFQSEEDPSQWIYDERVDQETIEVDGNVYRRDPDVFDTWFSSGQWPFITTGYPDGEDFKRFYPTSLMETGGEILYQWVGRMIMLGLYVTEKVPFKEVYIHGYVMAEDGAKMSKSKGNVISAMDILNQYGSDALRMGIMAGRSAGLNQGFSTAKVVAARNFSNKLWNVARYVETTLGDFRRIGEPISETTADAWILSKIHEVASKVTSSLEHYRFAEASDLVYHLLWDDFADWYVEASKAHLNKAVLAYGLETILKLAHPFAPFVTETIWQTLAWEQDSLLITAEWPRPPASDQKRAAEFEAAKSIITEVRDIVSTLGTHDIDLFYTENPLFKDHAELIKKLARLKTVAEAESGSGLFLNSVVKPAWLAVDETAIAKYTQELERKLIQQQALVKQLQKRLKNSAYVKNAPSELVEQSREQLAEAEALLIKLKARTQ